MEDKSSSEETAKTIEKLKGIALGAVHGDERIKAIETLAEFGNGGVPTLTDIAKQGKYSDERLLAMEKVKEVKSKGKTR